jgi:uridylate kinase
MVGRRGLVVKVSGTAVEMLDGSINIDYLKLFGGFIKEVSRNWSVAVTIGGGHLARRYIAAARDLGQPDAKSSLLGGDVGLINGRLMIAALDTFDLPVVSSPVESWDTAHDHLRSGLIPVLYGRWPGLTSDSVAVYFADYANMQFVIKLSNIDAIYDKDPRIYGDAKPFRYMSHEMLEEIAILKDGRKSGEPFVIDLLAARRLKNSGIPLLVMHKDSLDGALSIICQLHPANLSEGTLVDKPSNE